MVRKGAEVQWAPEPMIREWFQGDGPCTIMHWHAGGKEEMLRRYLLAQQQDIPSPTADPTVH
jgi:hypothetical protein